MTSSQRKRNPVKPAGEPRTAAVMFQVEPELKKKLIERAQQSDRSISAVVRQAVIRYLETSTEAAA